MVPGTKITTPPRLCRGAAARGCGAPGPRPLSRIRTPSERRLAVSTGAVITFVLVAGLVWGGLIVIVTTAMRKESRKSRD